MAKNFKRLFLFLPFTRGGENVWNQEKETWGFIWGIYAKFRPEKTH